MNPRSHTKPAGTGPGPARQPAAFVFGLLLWAGVPASPAAFSQIAFDHAGTGPLPMPGYAALLPGAIALGADISGDGLVEIVAGTDNICTVPGCGLLAPDLPGGILVIHQGQGGILPPQILAPAVFANRALAAADLDGDGARDLAVLGFQSGLGAAGALLQIVRNTGSGNLALVQTIPAPSWAATIALGDFDGNGLTDIALLGTVGSTSLAQAFMNQGALSFQARMPLPFSMPSGPARTGDVDGDGCDDILFTTAGGLAILFGTPSGIWSPPVPVPLPAWGASPADFCMLDVDQDQIPDIVAIASAFGISAVLVFTGTGTGTFSAVQAVLVPQAAVLLSITPGDLDGDGDQDLVVAYRTAAQQDAVAFIEHRPGEFALLPGDRNTGGGPHPVVLRGGPRLPHVVALNRFSDSFTLLANATPQVVVLGTPALGGALPLSFESPRDPGLAYVAALSLDTVPAIPLPDGRDIRLAFDPLLVLSLVSPFPGFQGTLAATGAAPALIGIPPDPALAGHAFFAAFLAMDPAAPSGVRSISPPRRIPIP